MKGSFSSLDGSITTSITKAVKKGHKFLKDARGLVKLQSQDSLQDPAPIQACSGWKLVVVGHSLGAGTAILLALKLREKYPDLKCWAFAAPAGLVSADVGRYVRSFATNMIVGDDMIARLSIASMEDLRDSVVKALV